MSLTRIDEQGKPNGCGTPSPGRTRPPGPPPTTTTEPSVSCNTVFTLMAVCLNLGSQMVAAHWLITWKPLPASLCHVYIGTIHQVLHCHCNRLTHQTTADPCLMMNDPSQSSISYSQLRRAPSRTEQIGTSPKVTYMKSTEGSVTLKHRGAKGYTAFIYAIKSLAESTWGNIRSMPISWKPVNVSTIQV